MDAFDSNLVERGKCCGVHVQAMQEVEVWLILVCQQVGGFQSTIYWAVQEVLEHLPTYILSYRQLSLTSVSQLIFPRDLSGIMALYLFLAINSFFYLEPRG